MAITLANVITNLDTYLGDSSTDRISQAERFQAITEATTWLLEELGNEHMVDTYPINFVDSINYYKVTNSIADLLVGGDLRRTTGDHYQSFTRKSPREIATEISSNVKDDPSWAIERRDGETYVVINYNSKYVAKSLMTFDSLTERGNTYSTTGDITNVTLDNIEYKQGSGSVNFDVDVSLSGGNGGYVIAALSDAFDLSEYEDLGTFLFDIYIPDVTYITSVTLEWGDGVESYLGSTTTDSSGNAFVNGWNTVKFDWNGASPTGAVDLTSINTFTFGLNYSASQPDDTDFRLDNLRITLPEVLTLHYVSWNVGENNSGTDITTFSAATDVPFYSGRYDQYRYAVAHKAAAILFYSALRLTQQGAVEESEAIKALNRYRDNFESNKTREVKNFKVFGVNLRQHRRRRKPRIG